MGIQKGDLGTHFFFQMDSSPVHRALHNGPIEKAGLSEH